MTIPAQMMSVTDFDQWILQTDEEGHFEYIGGEIIKVVSNQYASKIAAEILFRIKLFLKENGIKGYVTGADGQVTVISLMLGISPPNASQKPRTMRITLLHQI